MADQPPIESVEADTILGKYKVTGANVNTLITILGFVMICLIAWTLYAHTADAKEGDKETAKALRESNAEVAKALRESNKEVYDVMKDMARAVKEQNCWREMQALRNNAPLTQREIDSCKRLAQ
jgi:type VI protein secretion system component VasK